MEGISFESMIDGTLFLNIPKSCSSPQGSTICHRVFNVKLLAISPAQLGTNLGVYLLAGETPKEKPWWTPLAGDFPSSKVNKLILLAGWHCFQRQAFGIAPAGLFFGTCHGAIGASQWPSKAEHGTAVRKRRCENWLINGLKLKIHLTFHVLLLPHLFVESESGLLLNPDRGSLKCWVTNTLTPAP